MHLVVEAAQASVAWTPFWVWGVGTALPLALAALAYAWAARHRRLGPRLDAAALHGRIADDGSDPTGPVIRVEIRQVPRRTKNGTYWVEKERHVAVRPFDLLDGKGARHRIEPDEKVGIDAVFVPLGVAGGHRSAAELRPGDAVYVVGEVTDAPRPTMPYRTAEGLPIVRAPRLVLRELPSKTHRARARYHTGWALAFAVVALASHAVYLRYHELARGGRPCTGTIHDKSTYLTHSKNGTTRHYVLSVVYALDDETHAFVPEVRASDWAALDRGDEVEVLAEEHPRIAQLGTVATINVGGGVCVAIALFLMTLFYGAFGADQRPWREKRRVVLRG